MVWAGIIGHHVIGPYYFDKNVDAESYLNLLGNYVVPELHILGYNERKVVFHQDGAPAHFSKTVTNWLDENFDQWIGRGGTLRWPPRSPDLTPLDFFYGAILKTKYTKYLRIQLKN